MDTPETARRPLSRRKNSNRAHIRAKGLKMQISSTQEAFFNIVLPVRTHVMIKLYSSFNGESMGKIMTRVVVDWVEEHLQDVREATIEPPKGDLRGNVCFGISLPKDVHVKIKLVASIRKISMREVVIPILNKWIEENCTGPEYSERLIRAMSHKV